MGKKTLHVDRWPTPHRAARRRGEKHLFSSPAKEAGAGKASDTSARRSLKFGMAFTHPGCREGQEGSGARSRLTPDPHSTNVTHHRVSGFHTPASSNPPHFLYAFTLNTLLFTLQRAPCTRKHQERQPERALFVRLTNPLRDRLTIRSAQHPDHVSFHSSTAQESDSADGGGTVHTSQRRPRDLNLLQLSRRCASRSLNPAGLPAGITPGVPADSPTQQGGTAGREAAHRQLPLPLDIKTLDAVISANCPALGCPAAAQTTLQQDGTAPELSPSPSLISGA